MALRKRLCFAPGPWQLITLAAALQSAGRSDGTAWENHLVLYDPDGSGEEYRTWMDVMAPASRCWASITWDDTFPLLKPDDNEWPWPAMDWTCSMRAGLGQERVDEIWLAHLHGLHHRLILEAYPGASTMIYEDGFLSPIEIHRTRIGEMGRLARNLAGALKKGRCRDHLASRRLSDWRLRKWHVRKLARAYVYLAELPRPPPYDRLPVTFIRREDMFAVMDNVLAVERVRAELDGLRDLSERDVLLLNQSFHRGELIAKDVEFNILRRAVRFIVERGYRVIWKDHPREAESFYPRLAQEFGDRNVSRFAMSHALPIQLAARHTQIQMCVSASSASLFYLRDLFGAQAYTFVDLYHPHFQEMLHMLCFDVVASRVPALSDLPPFRPGDHALAHGAVG